MNRTTHRAGHRADRRPAPVAVLALAVLASLFGLEPAAATPATPARAAEVADSPAAPTIQTVVAATSAAAPGALATADVSLLNTGLAAAGAPVTLSFSGLPVGAALVGLTSTELGQAWSCAPTTGGGTCTLVTPGTTTPMALDGESAASGQLELDLTATDSVGVGIELRSQAAVGPDTAPAPDLTKAVATATLAPLAAGAVGSLALSDRVPDVLEVTAPGTGDLTVRNLGPAAVGGPGAPVVLSGVVPAGTIAGRAGGDGWSCGGSPVGCTWTGPPIGVGGELPPVTVSFTAPATATTAPIVTTRTVTAVPAGQAGRPAVQASRRHELVVLEQASPNVVLTAEAPVSGVEAPGTVETHVVVSGSGLEAPEGGIDVVAVPPVGFSYRSAAGAGWSCAPGGSGVSAIVCRRREGIDAGATAALSLSWAVGAGTAVGPARVVLAATVAGEAEADQADGQATVEYEVVRPPAAAVTLRTWHYPGNAPSPATDGRALTVTPGRTAQIGVDGVNSGSSPIATGTRLRLTTTLPKGAKAPSITTDVGGPAWACALSAPAGATATALVCTTTLARPVAVEGTLPRLRFHVLLPAGATVGRADWAVALVASQGGKDVAGLAAVTTKAVSVVAPVATKAEPSVAIESVHPARRGGRTGSVRVTYGNGGTARGPETSVLIYLQAGVFPSGALPRGCITAPRYYYPARAICWFAPLAPGATSSVTLATRAAANARPDGTARADAYVGAKAPVRAEARMVLLDALAAQATATPSTVTSPALGGTPATVLLDGRASRSSAADATWRQVRAAGHPIVVWDGAEGAASATGLTASFATPVVSTRTVLRFRLTVADGTTSTTADTTVTVDPVPDAGAGEQIGWGADSPFGRLRRHLSAEGDGAPDTTVIPIAVAGDEGDTWTVTDGPEVQRNDTGGPRPVIGSRVRLLRPPTFRWDGSGPEPTDVTTSIAWEQCRLEGSDEPFTYVDCTEIGTDPVLVLPDNNVGLVLRTTIRGMDTSAQPVVRSTTYDVGVVGSDYSLPVNLVPPSIEGLVEAGETLQANPGEWSLEFAKEYRWSRCTPGTAPRTCTEIAGAIGPTYVVGSEVQGSVLRLAVSARAREGQWSDPVSVDTVVVPGDTDCRGACWRFDEQPEVRAHPDPWSPVTAGFAAEITGDGRATWLDPANPPTDVTTTRGWRQCLVADPAACTTATGSTFLPQRTGVTLHAVITVRATYPVTGQVETQQAVVDLGEVQAPAQGPANLTAPAVAGTPIVGSTLTADPGTWDYAIRGDGPPGSEFGYRWLRCGWASGCVDTGVTTASYLVASADLGAASEWFELDVTARGVVPEAHTTVRSGRTTVITAAAKRAIAEPTYLADGPLAAGTLLTLVPAVFSAEPASDLAAPEIRWERCRESPSGGSGPPSLTCSTIASAEGSHHHRLVLADVGHRIRITQREVSGGNETLAVASLTGTAEVTGPTSEVSAATGLPGDEASIPNSGELELIGSAGGESPFDTGWTQVSGPAAIVEGVGDVLLLRAPASGTGELVFRYSVTDALGRTAHADATITYGEVDVPGLVCELVNTITGGGVGPKTFALGSTMTLGFTNATVTGGFCGEHTELTITGATVTLHDWLQLTAQEVVVTPDGVTFDGVELTARDDAALGGVRFRVAADLAVPFSGDLDELELTGSVIADGIPFVSLPGSWRGAELISFSSVAGTQAMAFDAVAYHDPGGPEVELGDELPTPPEGAPTLEISGGLASDRTFDLSVAATGLVTFADTGIDFAGSVARTEPEGDVSVAVLGTLASPVALATGVRLESAGLGWDGTTFTGNGELAVAANGSKLTVAAGFSFENPRAWSASLSVGGGGTWRPASGIAITDPTVSGAISRVGSVTSISLAAEAARVQLGAKARIDDLGLAVAATCTAGSSCAPTVTLRGAVQAELASSTLRVSVLGTLDLAAGTFSLSGAVGGFEAMPGLSVGSATFAVSAGPSSRSVAFTAAATVLGTPATVTVAYDDAGLFVQASVGRWTPFTGAPTLNSTDVVYTSASRTVTIGGQPVAVPANTVYLTASSTPPAWFNDLLGTQITSAVVGGAVNLRTLDIDLTISFVVPNATLVDSGGVRIRLSGASFRIRSLGGVVSVGLGAEAELRLPGIGGGSTTTTVALTGSYEIPTGRFTASITKPGVWSDAFGISGLAVRDLSLALTLRPGTIPSVGLAGGVVLPAAWSQKIGMAAGAEVKLAASLGGSSNCIGFEIGRAGSTTTVIDVANAGAVTARHAAFYLSDLGCEIGPHVIPAGLTLAFDGALLGTPVWVQATVKPTPFTIQAEVKIGNFDVGGFGLKDTYLKLDISPSTQAIEFRATASVLGVTASVNGAFSRTASGVKLDFAGAFRTPSLGGFALDELTVAFSLSTGATTTLSASGAARVRILGQPQAVAFAFNIVNGKITRIAGSVAVDIQVEVIRVVGTANVVLVQDQFPSIAIAGRLVAGGHPLASASLVVQPNGLQVSAALNLPKLFGTAPSMSGTIAWASTSSAPPLKLRNQAGQEVTATPGSFRFDVTDARLPVAGFVLNADVTVASVGGVFWADLDTDARYGVDDTNAAVRLKGSFDSTGRVDIVGTGSISLAGFNLADARFTLTNGSGTLALTVRGGVAVPRLGSITMTGSFRRDSTGTWFELTGTAALRPGGYDLGTATFSLYRRPAETALKANARVDVAGLVAGAVTVNISSTGSMELSAGLGVTGTIGQVLGRPTATVSFRAGPTYALKITPKPFPVVFLVQLVETGWSNRLSFQATTGNAFGLGGFSVSGAIASGGSYRLTATAAAGPWSWRRDVGLCTAYLRAGGSFVATIEGQGSDLAIGIVLDASASAGCGSIGVSAGATAELRYVPPTSFTGSVKGRIRVSGIGTWRPTLFTLST